MDSTTTTTSSTTEDDSHLLSSSSTGATRVLEKLKMSVEEGGMSK
jgi:hypothetical protein